jgi:hypothetical protein
VTRKHKRLGIAFGTDDDAYQKLKKRVLGKRILFTDRTDLTDEEIIFGYRGQHHLVRPFSGPLVYTPLPAAPTPQHPPQLAFSALSCGHKRAISRKPRLGTTLCVAPILGHAHGEPELRVTRVSAPGESHTEALAGPVAHSPLKLWHSILFTPLYSLSIP